MGHFEKCCKTKLQFDNNKGNFRKDRPQSHGKKKSTWKKGSRVKHIIDDQDDSSDTDQEFVFTVTNGQHKDEQVQIQVGGIPVSVVVDSGASVNVIDRGLWEYLKQSKIKCVSSLKQKKLFAYGSEKSLTVAGSFTADVNVGDRSLSGVTFYVIEEKGQPLLGKVTAMELGVLQIGVPDKVFTVEDWKSELLRKYPECFTGLGKLKDFQMKIPLDESVKPVIQPLRRVPYHLREKLEGKLQELESLDIIEKVDSPSAWVSPIVIVPKQNGYIRLCTCAALMKPLFKKCIRYLPLTKFYTI